MTKYTALMRSRRIYHARKDSGLCVVCGKGFSEDGKVKCRICSDKKASYNNNSMKSYQYTCIHCGKGESGCFCGNFLSRNCLEVYNDERYVKNRY